MYFITHTNENEVLARYGKIVELMPNIESKQPTRVKVEINGCIFVITANKIFQSYKETKEYVQLYYLTRARSVLSRVCIDGITTPHKL